MRIATAVLIVGLGSSCISIAQAQEQATFEGGISFVHVSSEFGRTTTGLQRSDGSYTLSRPSNGAFNDATLALDLGYRVNDWLSLNLLTTGTAENTRQEQWTPDPPFPPAAPGSLPVPTTVPFDAKSEVRVYVISATLQRALSGATSGYVRLGAAFVQSELTLFDNQGAVFDRFDSDDTRPWLALGARHQFDGGLTLSTEFGTATEGHRMARLGIGWTF